MRFEKILLPGGIRYAYQLPGTDLHILLRDENVGPYLNDDGSIHWFKVVQNGDRHSTARLLIQLSAEPHPSKLVRDGYILFQLQRTGNGMHVASSVASVPLEPLTEK